MSNITKVTTMSEKEVIKLDYLSFIAFRKHILAGRMGRFITIDVGGMNLHAAAEYINLVQLQLSSEINHNEPNYIIPVRNAEPRLTFMDFICAEVHFWGAIIKSIFLK